MISFITSAVDASNYPESKAEVVFVGRSNVGKSSLINALYGKIAYVGKTPGKTRLLNFFDVDHKYTVCDAPGYGFAKVSKGDIIDFGKLMDTYFMARQELRLALLILDIRRDINTDDLDMFNYLNQKGIPTLIVLNKADKLSNNGINSQLNKIVKALAITKENCIVASTLNSKNIIDLRSTIVDFVDGEDF